MVEEDVETRSMITTYAPKVFWDGLTPSLFPFKSRWIRKVAHLVLQGKDLQVEGKENIGLGDHQVLAHLKTPKENSSIAECYKPGEIQVNFLLNINALLLCEFPQRNARIFLGCGRMSGGR